MTARHVAVIGAGASGTLQALHLLLEGAERVTLIERELQPGRGIAYGTLRPEHLLNVTARRMSVYPDDPDHFARWLGARGGAAEDYAPRMLFGVYLCELVAAAQERLEIVRGEGVAVTARADGEEVHLGGGGSVAADAAVLALGNLRPAPLPGIDAASLGALYVEDPWFGDLAEDLAEDDVVFLIGSGLTAVDAALTLDAAGFRGRVVAMSRRGLVPRPHVQREVVAAPAAEFPRSCTALLRAVRTRGGAIGWREAVHEIRQEVQRLWSSASLDERRRFLRHLRPWWDVHRHRIAPEVAARIEWMQREGRLRVAAGRLVATQPAGDSAIVTWRRRGHQDGEPLQVRRIVNCSGPDLDIDRAGDPLLDALLTAGRIRPDPCRLGVEVNAESRAVAASGVPCESLYAIGPITRGAFWESIAVADIAVQAQAVARRIAG